MAVVHLELETGGRLATPPGARLRGSSSGGDPGYGTLREGQGRGDHHGNQGKPVHHSQDVSAAGGEEKEEEAEAVIFCQGALVLLLPPLQQQQSFLQHN